jgi:hypothetical protein
MARGPGKAYFHIFRRNSVGSFGNKVKVGEDFSGRLLSAERLNLPMLSLRALFQYDILASPPRSKSSVLGELARLLVQYRREDEHLRVRVLEGDHTLDGWQLKVRGRTVGFLFVLLEHSQMAGDL